MNFVDDMNEAFAPLMKHATDHDMPMEKTLAEYMYMGDKDDTAYFKHVETRNTIKLKR